VERSDVDIEPQGGVAYDLVEVAHGHVVVADVADGGPGRGVDIEAGIFAELAYAEEVGGVGDDDDVVEIIFVRDGGKAVDLLLGVDGAGLSDDAVEGDSVGEEVVAADAAFGVAGVLVAAAAQGDDERSDVFAIELDGMVEAGVKDWRRVAGVLGCAEDGDGVGRLGVVFAGDRGDLLIDPDAPYGGNQKNQREETAEEETAVGGTSASQIGRRGDHRLGRTFLYEEGKRAHIREESATGSNVRRASLQGRSECSRQKLQAACRAVTDL
jgi:hypothetical protein